MVTWSRKVPLHTNAQKFLPGSAHACTVVYSYTTEINCEILCSYNPVMEMTVFVTWDVCLTVKVFDANLQM